MTIASSAFPAFGAADLTNCEREQIHLAGSIQPHGALLVVRDADQTIVQISANAGRFLEFPGKLLGAKLRALGADLAQRAREVAESGEAPIPYVVRCRLGVPSRLFNALLHRAAGGEIIIEIEPAGPERDYSGEIDRALQTIIGSTSLTSLCHECAHIFKEITGYDRVMVYRFDEEGHGEVFAETRKPDLEAFLGNRYPASDIPQIARRLYVKNRVRLLGSVDFEPVPITPVLSPVTGGDLDMSLCFLRSASPIHIQYLKNMGVGATLVVSLMVGEKLWGLVSCHHYSPRYLHFEMRAVCELLGEVIGTRIAALESFMQGQGELSVRRLEQRMVETISRDGDWRGALFDSARSILLPLGATGAALLFEGGVQTIGEVPGTEDIRALAGWMAPKVRGGIAATASLGAEAPAFARLAPVAAGLVAARISSSDDEMLLWFRGERVRTVTWGGNPFKPPSDGDDPRELSPRRSFAQWHQVVEGTSDPWTPSDLAAARLIGTSVTDVILQFRAASLVIARDQLEQVQLRVRESEVQVLVADARGQILESNSALTALIGAAPSALRSLDDLPAFFADAATVASRIDALRKDRQPWRGDAALRAHGEDGAELHIRADAVVGAGERLLGFVLLFTDLAARREAQNARRRFQDGILVSHRRLSTKLESTSDLKAQQLISSVIENAQLAAMEITDGQDVLNMPALLESIRTSVERTAEVLSRLSFQGDAEEGSST